MNKHLLPPGIHYSGESTKEKQLKCLPQGHIWVTPLRYNPLLVTIERTNALLNDKPTPLVLVVVLLKVKSSNTLQFLFKLAWLGNQHID